MRLRQRIIATLIASTAAVAGAGLVASPAHAAGTICSRVEQLDPGLFGEVCVSATEGGATNASAAFRNNSPNPVGLIFLLEITVVIVDGDSADIHTICGPGRPVQPGETVTCGTAATRFTTSPRFGSAIFTYDLSDRVVNTPQLS